MDSLLEHSLNGKAKGFISVLCGVTCKLTSSGSEGKLTPFSVKYQVSQEKKQSISNILNLIIIFNNGLFKKKQIKAWLYITL